MKSYRVTISTVMALFFIQTGFFANFTIRSALPNLILIFVIWLSLRSTLDNVLLSSVIGGFLVDVYSASPFGINILILLISGLIIHYSINEFLKKGDSGVFPWFVIFAYFLYHFLAYGFLYFLSFFKDGTALAFGEIFGWGLLIGFTYTFITSIIMFYFLERNPTYAAPQKEYFQSKY